MIGQRDRPVALRRRPARARARARSRRASPRSCIANANTSARPSRITRTVTASSLHAMPGAPGAPGVRAASAPATSARSPSCSSTNERSPPSSARTTSACRAIDRDRVDHRAGLRARCACTMYHGRDDRADRASQPSEHDRRGPSQPSRVVDAPHRSAQPSGLADGLATGRRSSDRTAWAATSPPPPVAAPSFACTRTRRPVAKNTVILPGSAISTTPWPKLGCSTRSPTSNLSLARYGRDRLRQIRRDRGLLEPLDGTPSARGSFGGADRRRQLLLRRCTVRRLVAVIAAALLALHLDDLARRPWRRRRARRHRTSSTALRHQLQLRRSCAAQHSTACDAARSRV